jgi:hypothetical protein
MRKNNNEIELINYEGPCLRARKKEGSIGIYDQWGKKSMTLDGGSLIDWTDGKINLEDTSGKIWIYSEHIGEAAVTREELINWLEE